MYCDYGTGQGSTCHFIEMVPARRGHCFCRKWSRFSETFWRSHSFANELNQPYNAVGFPWGHGNTSGIFWSRIFSETSSEHELTFGRAPSPKTPTSEALPRPGPGRPESPRASSAGRSAHRAKSKEVYYRCCPLQWKIVEVKL